MRTLPPKESGDATMASPADLTMWVREWAAVYTEHTIALPVSGDAITRGRAEWDRD